MVRAHLVILSCALSTLLGASNAGAQSAAAAPPASSPSPAAAALAPADPTAWPFPLFRPVEYVTTAVGAEAIAIGVDSVLVPVARGRLTMAEQLVLMDAESYAFSSLLTTTAYDLTGRARPSYADCQKNPSYDILCNSAPTASFWSGHTAEAFTGAGLSCAHHAYAHVYGDPLADALGCAGMITIGAATGTLRLLGDRHYATDVLTGALVGFGFGYGMPTVLHYAWPGRRSSAMSASLSPMSGGLGLRVAGVF